MSRGLRRYINAENAKRPDKLTQVPKEEWPEQSQDPRRLSVWVSRHFLVQVFQEKPDLLRISVNRVKFRDDGKWEENISWDELQGIKRAIGFGDCYAVEVYPRDEDVVNVSNMRHLWLMEHPLDIGWRT